MKKKKLKSINYESNDTKEIKSLIIYAFHAIERHILLICVY